MPRTRSLSSCRPIQSSTLSKLPTESVASRYAAINRTGHCGAFRCRATTPAKSWSSGSDSMSAILPRVERLYLQLNAQQVIASRGTSESTHEIGRYPLTAEALQPEQSHELEELAGRAREVVLCLPADKVMARKLMLPLVAEENLRQVLGFEMDRQTPFSLDQVY